MCLKEFTANCTKLQHRYLKYTSYVQDVRHRHRAGLVSTLLLLILILLLLPWAFIATLKRNVQDICRALAGKGSNSTREVEAVVLESRYPWLQGGNNKATSLISNTAGTAAGRMSVEEALRQSEEMWRRYEFIVNTSKDFMTLIDQDYTYAAANAAYCQAHHKTQAEIIGKTVAEVWGEKRYSTQIKAHLDRCFAGNEVHYQEWFEFAGLERRCFDVAYYPYYDNEGHVTHAVVISRDITRHKLAEEEIQRRNRELTRLSTAIEQTTESVIITDAEGTIVYVNPAFERISGYSRSETIGRNPRFLKSGHHDATFYRELWATLIAGQVWRGRFVNKKKSGVLYVEDAIITPVRGDDGTVLNYVGLQRDVTHELQLEEQYRQSQKMEALGRLAGSVAHDFNNILTVITGYSELLLKRFPNPQDPAREEIEWIKEASERASTLTRQLLAFGRRQPLQPQILNLNEVVTNLERMLRRLISEDIELKIRLDTKLQQVKADPGQIEQVLMNLIVNARDAMPQGGQLTIETANVNLDETCAERHFEVTPGAYVMLAVTDTGVGMDADTLAHVFEPFYTTKELGKGTGLGLATIYGIIRQSDGHIWVYSEPGHGTTFKIYLPRAKETVETTVYPGPTTSLEGIETVLLVEDEASVRLVARKFLENQGYSVLEAGQPEEALLKCQQREGPIDLLITDVILPKMGGRELAERLTQVRPELKVLYISGYTDDALDQHGILTPGVVFLEKPFSSESLARKVREVLDAS